MSALTIIQLVLFLLNGVLSAAIKSGLPAEIITIIQNSITELIKVHGTEVTKGQLDSLIVDKQW
jgi:hypothetical protein